MIAVYPASIDLEVFLEAFKLVDQKVLYEYFDELKNKKFQFFRLEYKNEVTHIVTSVTLKRGVRYLNFLEMEGAFGWGSYPNEFLEMAKELCDYFSCEEVRIILDREGAGRILKQHGFELKYSEYGLRIK
jgi:hypothetical protein